MRLRQIALNAVQQAIQEDRLARASHTRPHQLDLSQLVPGTTTVDLHRDGTWRGPAVLLEVDQSEGTAIIKYQGKPYLVSLRFIRPSQGIFYNIDTQVGTGLYKLMRMTEATQPYKQQVLGYKQILTHAGFQWKSIPGHPDEEQAELLQEFPAWASWTEHPIPFFMVKLFGLSHPFSEHGELFSLGRKAPLTLRELSKRATSR